LLGEVEAVEIRGDPGRTDVIAVTHDSRAVVAGALFCCVPGLRVDGHDYAPDAVAAGATALLNERLLPLDVTQVRVVDVRAAMAPVAAAFHGHPSRRLRVAGITGTNGKTTTAHLLHAVLEHHGWPTGLLGTLTGTRTTPEATELQARLAAFAAGDKHAVVMEVSSHALELHRVDATRFAVAVFTNLSPEHLDFHESMDVYFRAKARLFEPERTEVAVVNADDPYGRALLDAALVPTRPFSLVDAVDLEVSAGGSTFTWEGQRVHLRLGGVFNVANALAAATAAQVLGVPPATVAEALSAAPVVPGRFETVDAGQSFAVVVDYAHTPAGLEQVLLAARAVAAGGRVLLVFGCGGDRDAAKRPAMGEVAARLADHAVLTTDNPRREGPAAIAAAVLAGVARPGVVDVEPDRRQAIARALAAAGPGDVVVVAGKGHETEQVLADRTIPFDDRVVAREELARLQP
jgi:UDP-N-acetylmuramoyl-L-alanyl-D-glutamate--2,6-diaminopimelate ligase